MAYHPNKPYDDLLPLPPDSIDIEHKTILKKAISASRALSELNGAIINLPNPSIFIDSLNLQESQASSEIENIITTQDALFKASVADLKINDPIVKEVMHYKDALWFAVDSLKKRPILTTNLFISIVQIIKQNTSGIRNIPGTQLKNPATNQVVYTPPDGEILIMEKLKELENFIHANDDLDPIIKLALIHYQFEAIHPFFDGNGRTGRIIILLYMMNSGLLELPALFLSKYIMEHKVEYYEKLRGVTENANWQAWILYILDMIEQTAIESRVRIRRIDKLMDTTNDAIRELLPRVNSNELVGVIFKLPYTKRQFLVNAGLGTYKTVGKYLLKLEEAGILKSEQVGKERLFLNVKLMDILKD